MICCFSAPPPGPHGWINCRMVWNHSYLACAGPCPISLWDSLALNKTSAFPELPGRHFLPRCNGRGSRQNQEFKSMPFFNFMSTNIYSFRARKDLLTGNRLNQGKFRDFSFSLQKLQLLTSSLRVSPLSPWNTNQPTAGHSLLRAPWLPSGHPWPLPQHREQPDPAPQRICQVSVI